VYAPRHFREERPEVLLDVVRDIGAVTLVTPAGDTLHATHLPVLVTGPPEHPVLIGHIARANPHWQVSPGGGPAIMVATSAEGYVSPGWYPSKAEDPRVVPTWNHVHVQVHGRVEWVDATADKRAIVEALTEHHEAAQPRPWAVDDAPTDYIDKRLDGVVGLRFAVERLEGVFKLSQNQSDPNRDGVIAGLEAAADPASAALARRMRERPA
jgi:transcriptional regulator